MLSEAPPAGNQEIDSKLMMAPIDGPTASETLLAA